MKPSYYFNTEIQTKYDASSSKSYSNFSEDSRHSYLNKDLETITLEDNPNSQFSNLIDTSFALIKEISHDFEVGIYFFQPDSKLLELKSFSFDSFIDSITLENNFIENLNGIKPQNLFHFKDNS